jgi:hypothetical protein
MNWWGPSPNVISLELTLPIEMQISIIEIHARNVCSLIQIIFIRECLSKI